MKVGDLVHPWRLHSVVGVINKVETVEHPHRRSKYFVLWQNMHQSHGNRWFDEGDLEVISESR